MFIQDKAKFIYGECAKEVQDTVMRFPDNCSEISVEKVEKLHYLVDMLGANAATD